MLNGQDVFFILVFLVVLCLEEEENMARAKNRPFWCTIFVSGGKSATDLIN